MKKRVILILCVLAVLLTAVICLPFARKIDTTCLLYTSDAADEL